MGRVPTEQIRCRRESFGGHGCRSKLLEVNHKVCLLIFHIGCDGEKSGMAVGSVG